MYIYIYTYLMRKVIRHTYTSVERSNMNMVITKEFPEFEISSTTTRVASGHINLILGIPRLVLLGFPSMGQE